MLVGEAGSQQELQAVRPFDPQRSHHAFVLAFAGQVTDDACFRIERRFEFEQIVAASGDVVRIAVVKHQSFAAGVDDLSQLSFK
nr:hypothetical protein [Povalibacter uvarum]